MTDDELMRMEVLTYEIERLRAVAARARAEALEEAATTINKRAADYCVRADTAKSVWDRDELLHTASMLDELAAAIRARAAEGGERG